jgi:stage V sporulation protein K
MANVVSKLLLAMQLVRTSSVVFVNNSLELLGSYVGQTPQKVDAKVAEAAGGVLFIDEAYSIVKEGGGREGSGASFGKEAIDTLMKHLDPPSCVMIFAGYEQQMEDFLSVNPGLARRIPYRYHFHAYDQQQLMQIFTVMAQAKGETLADGVLQEVQPALTHCLHSAAGRLLSRPDCAPLSTCISSRLCCLRWRRAGWRIRTLA